MATFGEDLRQQWLDDFRYERLVADAGNAIVFHAGQPVTVLFAGHHQDRHRVLPALAANVLDQRLTVHLRHVVVGDDQIDQRASMNFLTPRFSNT